MRSEVSKRILSETSDERKQKVRESTNELLKTMKAKDKAEELIEKFGIEKAVLCVDEILKASPSAPILSDKGSFVNDIEESIEWWQQVKQEILNRQ